MTKILTDEADEILLDVREHLGTLIDHPGSEASKEQELQTAFNKIQEIIKLTDKPQRLLDYVPSSFTQEQLNKVKVLQAINVLGALYDYATIHGGRELKLVNKISNLLAEAVTENQPELTEEQEKEVEWLKQNQQKSVSLSSYKFPSIFMWIKKERYLEFSPSDIDDIIRKFLKDVGGYATGIELDDNSLRKITIVRRYLDRPQFTKVGYSKALEMIKEELRELKNSE